MYHPTRPDTAKRSSPPSPIIRALVLRERLGLVSQTAEHDQDYEDRHIKRILHTLITHYHDTVRLQHQIQLQVTSQNQHDAQAQTFPQFQFALSQLPVNPVADSAMRPTWSTLPPTLYRRTPGAGRTIEWIRRSTDSLKKPGDQKFFSCCKNGFPFCAGLNAHWSANQRENLPCNPVILCSHFLRLVGALWWRDRLGHWKPRWVSALLYTLPRKDRHMVKRLLHEVPDTTSQPNPHVPSGELPPSTLPSPEHNLLQLGKSLAVRYVSAGPPYLASTTAKEPSSAPLSDNTRTAPHDPLQLIDLNGCGHLFGLIPTRPPSKALSANRQFPIQAQVDKYNNPPQAPQSIPPTPSGNLWAIWQEACRRWPPICRMGASISMLTHTTACSEENRDA